MNRNPNKRLGAGPTDAEEIKKHAFFDSLSWDKVAARQYEVPKPFMRPINPQEITINIFEDATLDGNGEQVNYNDIPGWSFVTPQEQEQNMQIFQTD